MLDLRQKTLYFKVPSVQHQPESSVMNPALRGWKSCDNEPYGLGSDEQLVSHQGCSRESSGSFSLQGGSLKQPPLCSIAGCPGEHLRQHSVLDTVSDHSTCVINSNPNSGFVRIYAYREISGCNHRSNDGEQSYDLSPNIGTSFQTAKAHSQECTQPVAREVDLVEISKASEAKLTIEFAIGLPSLREVLSQEPLFRRAPQGDGPPLPSPVTMSTFGVLAKVNGNFSFFPPEALLSATEIAAALARVVLEIEECVKLQTEFGDPRGRRCREPPQETGGAAIPRLPTPSFLSLEQEAQESAEVHEGRPSCLWRLVELISRDYGYSARRVDKVKEAFDRAATAGDHAVTEKSLFPTRFSRVECESLSSALLEDFSALQLMQIYAAACALNQNRLRNPEEETKTFGLSSSPEAPPTGICRSDPERASETAATQIALVSLAASASQLLCRDTPDAQVVVLTKLALMFQDSSLLEAYLHANLYRVRLAPKEFPHVYLLCAPPNHPLCQAVEERLDAVAKARFARKDRQQLSPDATERVLLLAVKRGEYSEVEFYFPEGAVGALAQRAAECLRRSTRGSACVKSVSSCKGEEDSSLGGSRSPEEEKAKAKKQEKEREKELLLESCRVDLFPHCRAFLGSLRQNFWGTRFTLRDWGGGLPREYSPLPSEANPPADGRNRPPREAPLEAEQEQPFCLFAPASVAQDGAVSQRGGTKKTFPALRSLRWTPLKGCCKTSSENARSSSPRPFSQRRGEGVGASRKRGEKTEKSASTFPASSSPESFGGVASCSSACLAERLPHARETVLGRFVFSRNLSGDFPRRMKATLLREDGEFLLEPLPPTWSDSLGAFTQPFYGRALLPSAKNFQLTPQGGGDSAISFMFGKMEKDVFSVDFRDPVRIIEAAAMAAAALAKKRAVA